MIGADPTASNLRADVLVVVLDAAMWTQVAVLGGRWKVGMFGGHIDDLAAFYNDADVLVERNAHGQALLLAMQASGRSRLLPGYDDRAAFLTSVKGKKLLYDTLAQVVTDRDCAVCDRRTAMQVASVQASDLRAPKGLENGRADAFALAVWACANTDLVPTSVTSATNHISHSEAWNQSVSQPLKPLTHAFRVWRSKIFKDDEGLLIVVDGLLDSPQLIISCPRLAYRLRSESHSRTSSAVGDWIS